MKTIFNLLFAGLVLAGSWFGIRAAHQAYHSWLLNIYLVLFAALPLVIAPFSSPPGRQGFKDLCRSIFNVLAAGLAVSLVYLKLTPNWLWACLAGFVVSVVVNALTTWRGTMAQTYLNQATESLKANKLGDAVENAQRARTTFMAVHNTLGEANADLVLGAAYQRRGDTARAVRFLNNAKALYETLDQNQQVLETEAQLDLLRRQGVDVTEGAGLVSNAPKADWTFMLTSLLGTAFLIALFKLWQPAAWKFPLEAAVMLGVFVLLLVFGSYGTASLNASRGGRQRGVVGWMLLYSLGALALFAAVLGYLRGQPFLQVENFPASFAKYIGLFDTFLAGQPAWLIPAAAGGGALLMLIALIAAGGRSPFSLLGGLFGGDLSRQALNQAMTHIDAREWQQAILQLTRVDLDRERNPERRKEVLFCLAFSHWMAEHPAESRQYLKELFNTDKNHKHGLYLAGYMALKENNLEQAEAAFRQLTAIDANFSPGGRGKGDRTARYYLGLTLYRAAMQAMDKDVETGAATLSEVGKIGALDAEVADVLIKVHLYRAAQSIRMHDWPQAEREVKLAQQKLADQKGLIKDADELKKLNGYTAAASGVITYCQEHYQQALQDFLKAEKETQDLAVKSANSLRSGDSLLEQLLRLIEEKSDAKISPAFSRDLHFLYALALLHILLDELHHGGKPNVEKSLDDARVMLQESVQAAPDFGEGLAILGLLFYYNSADEEIRERGMEMLQTVHERVGSKFVSQTVANHENEQKRRGEVQQTYFNLLQQYLSSANIPLAEREAMRSRVVDNLRATGQYDTLVGPGSLEIETESEREPTVQEYMDRVALLREKLLQLQQLQHSGGLPADVSEMMDELNRHNQELQSRVKNISDIEQRLLLAAQKLL